MKTEIGRSFINALISPGRSPEIPADDDYYGWLVGSWEQDLVVHDPDGGTRHTKGEAHFAWVLEGRAIQDVWINPCRSDRTSVPSKFADWYGSTLRIYDPSSHAWQITWRDPSRGVFMDQVAHRAGKDIVQEGKTPDGATFRWRFTEISPQSFHWIGDMQKPNASTWTLQIDIHARRLC